MKNIRFNIRLILMNICVMVVLLISISGCVQMSKGKADEIINKEDGSIGDSENTEKEIEALNEKTKIVFWWWGDQEFPGMSDWMEENILMYEKMNPDVEIEAVLQNTDTLYTAYRTAGLSGKGPDLGMMWGGLNLFEDVWMGNVEALDDYFTKEELKEIKGADINKYKGKTYGLPYTIGSGYLFYNKTLFKEAGVDPDKFPETWDDFISICEVLKNNGITPYGMGTTEGFHACVLGDAIFKDSINKHFEILDPVLKKASWEDEKFLQYFNAVKDLSKYINVDAMSLDFYQGIELFPQKAVAMTWGVGQFAKTWVEEGYLDEDEIGVVKFPQYGQGTAFSDSVSLETYNWVLSPWSKNKKQACDFLKFTNTEDRVNALYLMSGAIPANTKFNKNLLDSKLYTEILNIKQEQCIFQHFVPIAVQYDGFATVFESLIDGSLSPSEAAKQVDKVVDKWSTENPEALIQMQEWYEDLKRADY